MTAAAAALLLAAVLAGCFHFDWAVFAVNDSSVDLIVRVEYEGGTRDVFIPAATQGIVIVLPVPRPLAAVSLLDPETCENRASAGLPKEAALVGITDGPTPGAFELDVYPEDVAGTETAADSRCAGH